MADKAVVEKYYSLLMKVLNNLKEVKEACEGYYEILVEPIEPGKTKAYKCVFSLRQNYFKSQGNSTGMTINQYYDHQLRTTNDTYRDFMKLTYMINSWLSDVRKEFTRDKYKVVVLTIPDQVKPKSCPYPDSDSEFEQNFNNDSDCEPDDGSTPKPYIKKCAVGHTEMFPTNSIKAKLRICTECFATVAQKYRFSIHMHNIVSPN